MTRFGMGIIHFQYKHLASWPLYAILVAVNLAVVAVIQLVEQQRLRTMQKLEQTIAELRAAERRADLVAI